MTEPLDLNDNYTVGCSGVVGGRSPKQGEAMSDVGGILLIVGVVAAGIGLLGLYLWWDGKYGR